jgi:peptidoglycan/xylan/chitin deacetylase (PgdA/CDA1 family)
VRAILTYHSIDTTESPVSVNPTAFRRHVEWLAAGRLRVVPLPELLRVPDGVDAVALTVDDGFLNFAEVAAPRLRAYGLAATSFVVAGHVGGTNAWGGAHAPGIPILPLLDWDDLGALAEQGFSIGAHTRYHPHLDGIASSELADEIVGAALDIERRLGVLPPSFAYPYGAVTDAAAALVRETFAVGVGTVLRPIRAGDDRAALPRLDMFYFRGEGRLESWGSSSFRRRLWLRAQARRVRQYVDAGRPRTAQ